MLVEWIGRVEGWPERACWVLFGDESFGWCKWFESAVMFVPVAWRPEVMRLLSLAVPLTSDSDLSWCDCSLLCVCWKYWCLPCEPGVMPATRFTCETVPACSLCLPSLMTRLLA